MKVLVFGATGPTGRQVVTQALGRGHSVTAFVRNPAALSIDDKRLRVWGEMHNAESGTLLATTEQLLLCVDQSGNSPKAARWPEPFAGRLKSLTAEHAALPVPAGAGEGIRLKRAAT